MNPSFTEEQLRAIARDARSRTSGGVTRNMCDVVSNEFSHYFEIEYDLRTPAAKYAPFRGRKHFVALLPASICRFAKDEGWVIIDATIQQFQEVVDGELPDVAILPPDDPRIDQWYDSVRTPEEW